MPRPSPPSPAPADGRSAEALLAALGLGRPIDVPAVVVAAHPDDETLGLGLRLATLRDLGLVHLTDGAPEEPGDARRAGFADRAAYAEARERELRAALTALGVRGRRAALRLRDQTAVFHLEAIVQALTQRLAGAGVVLTHAYEGGHPDHDAAAFAVQLACRRLARRGRSAPVRLEFAGYHRGADGVRVLGAFWPDPGHPSHSPVVFPAQLAAKRAALAAHRSQAEVIAGFDPTREAWRQAPDYDFTAPPPPRRALYDDFGWPLTSALWRAQARAVLAAEAERAT